MRGERCDASFERSPPVSGANARGEAVSLNDRWCVAAAGVDAGQLPAAKASAASLPA